MNALDWLMLGGLAVSALVGLLRGAAYELVSLVGWLLAFVLARQFSPWVADHLLQGIAAEPLRHGVAWVACFVLTLIAAGLLATLLRLLLRSTGLGLLDRSMGALFGVARGLLLVLLALFVARHTELPQSALWRGALLIPPATAALAVVLPLFPPALAAPQR